MVCANNIYTRVMDTNTPKNRSADINHVEHLWKKRFGIDASVYDRLLLYLQKPEDWCEYNDFTGRRYYKYAPEFTMEEVSVSALRNGYEFYLFGQIDSRPRWYDINIYYHQTLLDSLGGVALDGGRYFTSTPLTDGFPKQGLNWAVSYKFFIEGTINHVMNNFYFTGTAELSEAATSRERFLECVLVFKSEIEKIQFENYVFENFEKTKMPWDSLPLPYFEDIEGYAMDALRKDYADALILQRMLSDFRAYG